MTRILMDISPKIPRKRLQKMLRDSGYTRVGQDEPYDLFISTHAATDQSPLRLRRDEAVKQGADIPVMDEYELYARLWKPDCLANVLEERLDGSLRGRKIFLVGDFSDQEKVAVEEDARKHRAFVTTHPTKATLFVLGHRASTADPAHFRQMLEEKARRPYVKITGRAALMEKAQASPLQKKKRKGPDMRRLYHGRPNPDAFPDRYIALDLEATSTHPNNKIIEIGMVRYVNGEPQETFQSFVNPHQKLLPVIVDLTHITDDQLQDAPDIQALTRTILRFLQDDPVIGHSVQNDMKLLAENLNLPLDNNYIDTCKLAMTHFPNREKYSLRVLADDYGLTQSTHRALDDAITSMELLEKFRELFDTRVTDPTTRTALPANDGHKADDGTVQSQPDTKDAAGDENRQAEPGNEEPSVNESQCTR
ncbi:3'-5' exonuclease [Faecalibaculum rodentium]|uniref:3'-5' exonuclease n=1 Tax=Faecalibaculum rodentium TaxID=1702221 RepID=UPI0026173CC4|nr:3'-5' exonuclease [Faecalibaculum rodentium]